MFVLANSIFQFKFDAKRITGRRVMQNWPRLNGSTVNQQYLMNDDASAVQIYNPRLAFASSTFLCSFGAKRITGSEDTTIRPRPVETNP